MFPPLNHELARGKEHDVERRIAHHSGAAEPRHAMGASRRNRQSALRRVFGNRRGRETGVLGVAPIRHLPSGTRLPRESPLEA